MGIFGESYKIYRSYQTIDNYHASKASNIFRLLLHTSHKFARLTMYRQLRYQINASIRSSVEFAIFDTSSYLNDSRNEMNTRGNRNKACDATDRYFKKFVYRWGSISIVRCFYQFGESSNRCFKKLANRLPTINVAIVKSVNRQIETLRNSRIACRPIILLSSCQWIVKPNLYEIRE